MTPEEAEKATEAAGKYAEQYARTADDVAIIIKAFITGYEAAKSE